MSDLVARFDAVVADFWEPHSPPTPESVSTIARRLRCNLPPLLLEFAAYSKSFSSYFLSLGPDYQEYSHIICRNEMVRSHPDWLSCGPKAPDHYVFFTDNFMEDFFWCFDVSRFDGEHPVVYWSPYSLDSTPREYVNFEEWVTAEVRFYESK